MQVNSIVLSSGQTVDVVENNEVVNRAGVVLLHGSGTSERLSLRSLGASLADRGIVTVIPDWHPASPNDSVSPTLDLAEDVFDRMALDRSQRVIAGYSAGGPVALGLTLCPGSRFSRCVALACSTFDSTEIDREVHATQDVRILLIHGDADVVRPPSDSLSLRDELARLGTDPRVVVIPGGTHASVVCAEFEPSLQLSIPSPDLKPAMQMSVDAFAEFALT